MLTYSHISSSQLGVFSHSIVCHLGLLFDNLVNKLYCCQFSCLSLWIFFLFVNYLVHLLFYRREQIRTYIYWQKSSHIPNIDSVLHFIWSNTSVLSYGYFNVLKKNYVKGKTKLKTIKLKLNKNNEMIFIIKRSLLKEGKDPNNVWSYRP